MRALVLSLASLLALAFGATGGPAGTAPALEISSNQARMHFPDSISFQIDVTSASSITSVVLEYGDVQKTCGEVVAEAFPQFESSAHVRTEWAWDMRQSGSLPPGTRLWWRWRITDENGVETVTEQKTAIWLDDDHPWDTVQKGDVRLHWYGNSRDFAQQLLDAADAGLARIERDAGLSNDQPIDLYIYPNNQDMQNAILYEPGWTGGIAFPEQNIVIIGIASSDLSWGKTSEVHELTHVLVGHFTFTCLGDVPTWLNEGLAVYSEGALDPESQAQFDQAVRTNTLVPVRSLSGGFSEVPSKAYLSYSESYSIVKFLLDVHGRDNMNALLLALRDGNTVDDGLRSVYGFNVDGLEDAWREHIGAKARPVEANPTALPTPTFVPTIVPISGALPAVTPTPMAYPTVAPPAPTRTTPPLSLTLILACTCLALGLVLGVMLLGFVMQAKRKESSSEPHS